MAVVDQRLDRMIEIAEQTNQTLDAVVCAIGRVDQAIFDSVSANPETLFFFLPGNSSGLAPAAC